jgi:hypothetical protein
MLRRMGKMTLLDSTLDMLREHKRYRQIAEDTGLGYEWLTKLAQGRIPDPGVKRIETLHAYLANVNKKQ